MIIELAGVSGVGKSTVMRALIGVMRQNGVPGMSLDRVARRSQMSTAEAEARCTERYRALFELIRQGHKGQLETLRALTVTWERAASADSEVIAVVDEGFVHRLAYLCAELPPSVFDTALTLVPRANHLFVLEAPAEIATTRSIERRLPVAQAAAAAERAATATLHQKVADMLAQAVQVATNSGARAWQIDATRRPRRTAKTILMHIDQTI